MYNTYSISLILLSPKGKVLFWLHFTDEETEDQRVDLRLHGSSGLAGTEIRSVWSQNLVLNYPSNFKANREVFGLSFVVCYSELLDYMVVVISVHVYMTVPGLSCGLWDLVPWSGIKPGPPALGVQNLSHWTTGKVLRTLWSFPCFSSLHLTQPTSPPCFFPFTFYLHDSRRVCWAVTFSDMFQFLTAPLSWQGNFCLQETETTHQCCIVS